MDLPPNYVNNMASNMEYLNNTITFKEDIIQPDRMGIVKKKELNQF